MTGSLSKEKLDEIFQTPLVDWDWSWPSKLQDTINRLQEKLPVHFEHGVFYSGDLRFVCCLMGSPPPPHHTRICIATQIAEALGGGKGWHTD